MFLHSRLLCPTLGSSARRFFGVTPLLGALLLAGCVWDDDSKDDDDNGNNPPPVEVRFDLNVTVSGEGSVNSQPAGIDCGATCTGSFVEGSSVTLTAAPQTDRIFAGWGGDCAGTELTCTVGLSQARTVTASFTAPTAAQQALTVAVTGSGTVSSQPAGIDCGATCSAEFATGTSVTLAAIPAQGQVFSAWGGACTGAGLECVVALSEARSVTASFEAAAVVQHALSVAVTGSGAVRSAPAGIDCGTTCNANFADGATVTLTAAPAAGQLFQAWGGACSGAAVTCSVGMSEARSVTASFAAAPPAAAVWAPAARVESSDDFNVFGVLSAIAPNGDALVLWEQSDGSPNGSTIKVFSRRYVAGQGWDAAVTVPNLTTTSSTGGLVRGKLLMDASGTVTWMRDNVETRRYTAASGWGAPFLPPASSAGTLNAAAMDATGNISVLIADSDVAFNTLPAGGTWGSWVPVDTSGSLRAELAELALSSNGSATAVWRERNPGDNNYSLKSARYVGGTWQAPQSIETAFDNVSSESRSRVAMDAAGNAIAIWHQGDSMYYNVATASGVWGTPTQVDTGRVLSNFTARLQLMMTPDGRAVATWASGIFAVKSMQYTPGAGFSAPLTAASYGLEVNLGMDESGNAVLAYRAPDQWPNPTTAELNLYSRRLPWGSTAWSDTTQIETGVGEVENATAVRFNRAGQGVAAWLQSDSATTDVRNSLWSSVLR